jgi:hypothetical protein
VQYEDLVQDSERVLRELFAFLAEPWDPMVLRYYEQTDRDLASESSGSQVTQAVFASSVGRWREQMTPEAKAAFKKAAGSLLVELGYADSNDW